MKAILILSALLLSACATLPPQTQPERFFADRLFVPLPEPIDPSAVFAVSDAMQAFINQSLATPLGNRNRVQAMVDALYTKGQLQLEYDSTRTRTAAEAFEARAGNCLSLVLMTAAIAKQLALPVIYQQVYVSPSWTRSNDIAFASDHVNLVLGRRAGDARMQPSGQAAMTIDFLPSEQSARHARPLSESTVVAMYFNNRAAEALAAANTDAAYWWARAAIVQEPNFLAAYNTLGVIYLHHGMPTEATQVLSHVLALEPDNTLAMSNLVVAWQDQGRPDEAQQLAAQLLALEPIAPFHFFDLGMAALQAGDYRTAKQNFEREIRRDVYASEFHFWLAIAEKGLGNTRAARRQLEQALDTSTTRQQRGIYLAKLDHLKGSVIR